MTGKIFTHPDTGNYHLCVNGIHIEHYQYGIKLDQARDCPDASVFVWKVVGPCDRICEPRIDELPPEVEILIRRFTESAGKDRGNVGILTPDDESEPTARWDQED
jgi:hypothetical protein